MFKKNSANSLDRQIWSSLTLVLANLYNLNALKQSFCKFFKVAWLGHNAILSQGRVCVLGDREEGDSSIWGDVTVVVKSLKQEFEHTLFEVLEFQNKDSMPPWKIPGFLVQERVWTLWISNVGLNQSFKKLKLPRI